MPPVRYLIAPAGAPLFAMPFDVDGKSYVCYSTDDLPPTWDDLSEAARDVLSLVGAWNDLDWESTAAELDRIRHESRPTPPIDDL